MAAADRFDTLDAFRGIAALAVAQRHAASLFDVAPQLGKSYLAVDLFFVLSGFVIAHRYERDFAAGLSTGGFMLIRLKRLYPLYLLGLLLGLIVAVAGMVTGRADWSSGLLLLAFMAGALYLPLWVATPNGNAPYPLNAPSWSLFFEMVANLFYAAIWKHLSKELLTIVVLIALLGLGAAIAWWGDANLGWDFETFWGGFARVGFSFFAGVWLYRFRNHVQGIVINPILWGTILLLVLAAPARWNGFYDAGAIFVIFPALVVFGSKVQLGRFGAPLRVLGDISYALYAIHVPLLGLLYGALILLRVDFHQVPFVGVFALAALIFGAYMADRLIDKPIRRRLMSRKRVAAPAQA